MKKFVLVLLFIPVIGFTQEDIPSVNYPEGWEDLPVYEEEDLIESGYSEWTNAEGEYDASLYYESLPNYDDYADPTAHEILDEAAQIITDRGMMRQSRALITDSEPMEDWKWWIYKHDGAYGGDVYTVRFLNGELKGEEAEVDFIRYEEDLFREGWEVGDRVIVGYVFNDDGEVINPSIYGNDRLFPIFMLIGIFIAGVLILGRKQGALSLTALIVTVLLIFTVFIPLVLNGHSPLLWAIIISIASTLITFLMISGFTFKTLAATLGSVGGFLFATLIMVIFGKLIAVTGVMDSNIVYLRYSTDLNIGELIFAAMLIGAVGAIMDVAISMASTVQELRKANPKYTSWELFTSSLNVGKDLMGTMVNTLILAYVGTTLPFIILIYLQYSGTGVVNIINLEAISQEILRGVVGSLGMFLTIPSTAFFAAYMGSKSIAKETEKK